MNTNQGCVIWLTGISGAGKSTIASAITSILRETGKSVFEIDGDVLRHGLSNDLSFSSEDRLENMRRAAEVAQMASACGLIALVSLISPSEQGRHMARQIVKHKRFVQVYVQTPLEVAEARDVKGLYRKARAGLIPNFTGIGSDYEVPTDSEILISTATTEPIAAAQKIIDYVSVRNWL